MRSTKAWGNGAGGEPMTVWDSAVWPARTVGRAARWNALTLSAGLVAGFSLIFLLAPSIDLAVSAAFHDPASGFALSQSPVLRLLRKSSSFVTAVLVAACLARIALAAVSARRLTFTGAGRAWFLLGGLGLASGLLVNMVLKGFWGRPRPVQTDLFGGEAPYAMVWRITDGCQTNCSFVSGEASSAAWMVCAVALLVPAAHRVWAVPATAAYALALSLNRIAFGGHYLSDVLLSWALTALVLALLHRATVMASVTATTGLAGQSAL